MICPLYSVKPSREADLGNLWNALARWDRELAQHGQRTAEMATRLTRALEPAEPSPALEWAARLHDIGKVAVPRALLNKGGPLTEEERRIVQVHPAYSYSILRRTRVSPEFLQTVLFHHERFDGKGYPVGLKGEDIPLAARILSVADAYSALTSKRSYRGPYAPAEALAIMQKAAGRAFDPRIMAALQELMRQRRWRIEGPVND